MNKYIRLENDIVVEIFKTTSSMNEIFHESMGWTLCSMDSVGVGDRVVDGKLVQCAGSDVNPLLERQWRDSELLRSDVELYKAQDGDSKSAGSVTDWRSYRKSLRAWPESEYFPSIKYRPKAPDAKE